ncbi:helix-turn-helix domain-containing protein [Bacillus canaveralius]|uniref:helix-turn-helix domain-containing protein n=1 Tax=Bacillus canaveralius TaxID=1403243 RepID=UPI001FECD0CC|nr:helix-turn-helix transcriptional regulator [Bacillus canaveralius]
MKLISRIGEVIEKSGLRDDFIAGELKVSKRTVYNWKKGLSYPTFETAFFLARLLNCSADELAFIVEEEEK